MQFTVDTTPPTVTITSPSSGLVTASGSFDIVGTVNDGNGGNISLIAGLDKTTQGLDRDEGALKDLITNFNTTMASFASHNSDLSRSIHLLAPTLDNANKALTSLNNSFPNTRAFAREILPGVRETPATINASFPWITQTRKLLGKPELEKV